MSGIARNDIPEEKYVNDFNKVLSTALKNLELKFNPHNRATLAWKKEAALEKPLFFVVKSAYDLLISDKAMSADYEYVDLTTHKF